MGGHDRDHRRFGSPSDDGAGGQGVPPADAEGPLDDLSTMQADDALLDALGGTDPDIRGELADQELAALLLSWRQEADSEPMAKLVDTDMAMAVITQAKARTNRRRHRLLVPVATAAAVLSIAFTGVGLAAKGAEPGDALWGLTKVLYAEHATSVEAASTAQSDLDAAREAIAAQDYERARALLDRAQQRLGSVQGEDGKDNLRNLHDQLKREINAPGRPGQPPANASKTASSSQSSSSGPTNPGTTPPGSGTDGVPGPGDSDATLPDRPVDPERPTDDPERPTDPSDDTSTPPDDDSSTPPPSGGGGGGTVPSTGGGGESEGSSSVPFEAPAPTP